MFHFLFRIFHFFHPSNCPAPFQSSHLKLQTSQFKLHPSSFTLLLAAATLALTACKPAAPTPGLNKLEIEFRAANKASSIAPMLALYHIEGSDERTISHLQGALRHELGLTIGAIRFEALKGTPEETIDFTHKGIAYGPSLPPRQRMQVTYTPDTGDFTSLFIIGKTPSSRWRIICAKPKPALSY